jgi:hypothetical protein
LRAKIAFIASPGFETFDKSMLGRLFCSGRAFDVAADRDPRSK